MIESSVKEAFNFPEPLEMEKLSTGLINHTYKTTFPDGQVFLLQSINTKVFDDPDKLQRNYLKIQRHFLQENAYRLPGILKTHDGGLLFKGPDHVWRCFEYILDTYSPVVSSTPDQAYLVSACFGNFSAKLDNMDPLNIQTVLPGFHDLGLRFIQFTDALAGASDTRKKAAADLIKKAADHEALVGFFAKVQSSPRLFPLHILHHDCKIANILFKNEDDKIYCPIDLDTTQPGLFISDIGDMIRSMVPNLPEDHQDVKDLDIRGDFYEAIKAGYLESMHAYLSSEELAQIDMSGKLIVYMQALRFLTDYLNDDIYYQISYSEQNLDRAANQFRLLELIIDYVEGQSQRAKIYVPG
ncbi:Phosphotransferase enzyme family protein [Arachidicoccus rhizosphaerae]|uniref:Phosphotransferase enzyme family protein n=1 Tax=Arachidicoccus rhizosphaerae TaxID=551991 RepID=A0A1H3YKN3_9BACT|nr:phosphotransferase [Arachidicoccus rhizosphaerae]SEA12105.1 Phosphotransferase enzyme family protein [Arachidicoccus rhizosphaerae]